MKEQREREKRMNGQGPDCVRKGRKLGRRTSIHRHTGGSGKESDIQIRPL